MNGVANAKYLNMAVATGGADIMIDFNQACKSMPKSDIGIIKNVTTEKNQVHIEYEALTIKHIDFYKPGTYHDNEQIEVVATLNDDRTIPIYFSDIAGGILTIHEAEIV